MFLIFKYFSDTHLIENKYDTTTILKMRLLVTAILITINMGEITHNEITYTINICNLTYHILLSIMTIQLQCAPEFHNDFWRKKLFLFFKNNFTRINHCIFTHHKSHLKPLHSYLPCVVRREYFSIISV